MSRPTSFYFLKDMLQHYVACHYDQIGIYKQYQNLIHNTSIHAEMQSLEFANWEEFLSWKTAEEGRKNTKVIFPGCRDDSTKT